MEQEKRSREMDKPRVVLEDDGIYLEEPIDENKCRITLIMTKEVFIEAFEKWILFVEEQEHECK